MLHAGNIRRGGEWIETQILASGPRTNPWFQEASSRVIENGDILAYDTDLVGAYGMCIDISRSWIIGDKRPDATQQQVYDLALEQINRNMELMKPGTTIHELTHRAWTPPVEDYRHYSVLFHGVGLCDEWPSVYFPAAWDEWGQDYALEPGVVMTVEAFVGSRAGGQGVKLEEQVVITETGCELVANYPLSSRASKTRKTPRKTRTARAPLPGRLAEIGPTESCVLLGAGNLVGQFVGLLGGFVDLVGDAFATGHLLDHVLRLIGETLGLFFHFVHPVLGVFSCSRARVPSFSPDAVHPRFVAGFPSTRD